MTKRKFMAQGIMTLSIIFACCLCSCGSSGRGIENKSELVVAMDTDMPGYFALEGEQYGYHYDILQDYANRIGATLRIITGKTGSECRRMLEEGGADMVASITPGKVGKGMIPIYTTSYVVLAPEAVHKSWTWRRKAETQPADFRGKRVLISSGFKASGHYDRLIDSLRESRIFISDNSALELMGSLSKSEYDYLICEKSEALLGMRLYPNLDTVYDFEDGVQIAVSLSKKVKGLKEDFTEWLTGYRSGHEYTRLGDLYFENADPALFSRFRSTHGRYQNISQFDEIIQCVARREGLDWRFLSAIAYHESRFKPNVVSPVGARGIMQVMPVVARNFDVPVEQIGDTETNVTLAAKLLKSIEGSMRFPASMPVKDKMGIVLACYNAGVGHVSDARRLAKKYGYSPNSWDDVSYFLGLKSLPEYYCDAVVRNGMFRNGGQTSAFVGNVMEKYNNYCVLAAK